MLSENIKNLRMKSGLSQEELAEKLHVVRQTVSKWEKALSVPDADMLLELCRVFGVSAGEMLGEQISPESETVESLSLKLQELNEQTAAVNRKNRILMRVGAGFLLFAAFCFLMGSVIWLYIISPILFSIMTAGQDVAVIGCADGPTSIYVAVNGSFRQAVSIMIAIVNIAAAALLIRKSRRS